MSWKDEGWGEIERKAPNQDFEGGTVIGLARALGHNHEQVSEETSDELLK